MNSPLPPNIRVSSGMGIDERPVVRLDLVARVNAGGGTTQVHIVLPPRQMRLVCMRALEECDRVERAWPGEDDGA